MSVVVTKSVLAWSYLGKWIEVVEAIVSASLTEVSVISQVELIPNSLVTWVKLDVSQVVGAQDSGGGVVVDQVALLSTLKQQRTKQSYYEANMKKKPL